MTQGDFKSMECVEESRCMKLPQFLDKNTIDEFNYNLLLSALGDNLAHFEEIYEEDIQAEDEKGKMLMSVAMQMLTVGSFSMTQDYIL